MHVRQADQHFDILRLLAAGRLEDFPRPLVVARGSRHGTQIEEDVEVRGRHCQNAREEQLRLIEASTVGQGHAQREGHPRIAFCGGGEPRGKSVGVRDVAGQVERFQVNQRDTGLRKPRGRQALQAAQRLRAILAPQSLTRQLQVRVEVCRVHGDRLEERFVRGGILAGGRQMIAVVIQDIGAAWGRGDRAAVKLRGVLEAIQVVERHAEQAERRRVIGVRRHLRAQLLLGRLEIAALNCRQRIAKYGAVVRSPAGRNRQHQDRERQCGMRRRTGHGNVSLMSILSESPRRARYPIPHDSPASIVAAGPDHSSGPRPTESRHGLS